MKLWGGRFIKASDSAADHFHSSISFDQRLCDQDIRGSLAHAKMLGEQGILSREDSEIIQKGLTDILTDLREGRLTFDESAEDIHSNIEALLIERIGEPGKKLHTGRSRNDQVALDMRLYVLDETEAIQSLLLELLKTLTALSQKHLETILPGYTHMQRAQPVTLAHHLLAYAEMFKRDADRLKDAAKRANVSPLGSAALAATTYRLDRERVRALLGMDAITLNSLDAVADRDFCLELLSALSILMMHLSRFCEEIVLWSSYEFQFIEIDDAYATGSSIMPQKKNPDMAELIRGKTGRVYGDLMGLLTVMKGLPLAYNTDMQEDKESVFDAIDTVKMCLPVFTGMIRTMTVRAENMRAACTAGFINATDAADWLVEKGASFRDAHAAVGRLVLYCAENKKTLEELTLEEWRRFSPLFDEGVISAVSVE
ncbi:MAG: argininosuccinate lyase, partial [Clostridiales bacterium]|nr:argininosuccinate lyase [Clostridiales bacterium]